MSDGLEAIIRAYVLAVDRYSEAKIALFDALTAEYPTAESYVQSRIDINAMLTKALPKVDQTLLKSSESSIGMLKSSPELKEMAKQRQRITKKIDRWYVRMGEDVYGKRAFHQQFDSTKKRAGSAKGLKDKTILNSNAGGAQKTPTRKSNRNVKSVKYDEQDESEVDEDDESSNDNDGEDLSEYFQRLVDETYEKYGVCIEISVVTNDDDDDDGDETVSAKSVAVIEPVDMYDLPAVPTTPIVVTKTVVDDLTSRLNKLSA